MSLFCINAKKLEMIV